VPSPYTSAAASELSAQPPVSGPVKLWISEVLARLEVILIVNFAVVPE